MEENRILKIKHGEVVTVNRGFLNSERTDLCFAGFVSKETYILSFTRTDGFGLDGFRVSFPIMVDKNAKEINVNGLTLKVVTVSESCLEIEYK